MDEPSCKDEEMFSGPAMLQAVRGYIGVVVFQVNKWINKSKSTQSNKTIIAGDRTYQN